MNKLAFRLAAKPLRETLEIRGLIFATAYETHCLLDQGESKASSRNLKATATTSSSGVLALEPSVSPLLSPGPHGKAKGDKKLVSGSSFPSKARTQQKSVKSSTIRTSHDDQLLF